jgi:hypothetical protein
MLSRLDNVLAIVESARVSGCVMRTDCDDLLMHGIEVETPELKCLPERPDVVDLHKGTRNSKSNQIDRKPQMREELLSGALTCHRPPSTPLDLPPVLLSNRMSVMRIPLCAALHTSYTVSAATLAAVSASISTPVGAVQVALA